MMCLEFALLIQSFGMFILPSPAWESSIELKPPTYFGFYTRELVSHRKTPQHSSLLHAALRLLGDYCHRHLDQQEARRGGYALLTLPGSLVAIFVCPIGSKARGESSVSSGIREVPSEPGLSTRNKPCCHENGGVLWVGQILLPSGLTRI